MNDCITGTPVFIVLKNCDMIEGRGPMKFVGVCSSLEKYIKFINEHSNGSGVYGFKPEDKTLVEACVEVFLDNDNKTRYVGSKYGGWEAYEIKRSVLQ